MEKQEALSQRVPPSPRNKKNRIVFVVVIVVSIILIGGVFFSLADILRNEPAITGQVLTFVQALDSGNIDEAYALTSSEFRNITSQEELSKFNKLLHEEYNTVEELKLKSLSAKLASAWSINIDYTGTFIDSDGKEGTLYTQLLKVGDEYIVNGFTLSVPFENSLVDDKQEDTGTSILEATSGLYITKGDYIYGYSIDKEAFTKRNLVDSAIATYENQVADKFTKTVEESPNGKLQLSVADNKVTMANLETGLSSVVFKNVSGNIDSVEWLSDDYFAVTTSSTYLNKAVSLFPKSGNMVSLYSYLTESQIDPKTVTWLSLHPSRNILYVQVSPAIASDDTLVEDEIWMIDLQKETATKLSSQGTKPEWVASY